jgi:hypothetical protein
MKTLLFVPAIVIMVVCGTCEAASGDDLVEILRVVHALTDDRGRNTRSSSERFDHHNTVQQNLDRQAHFSGSRDEWKHAQEHEQQVRVSRGRDMRVTEASRNFRDSHDEFINGTSRDRARSAQYRPQPAPAPRSSRDNVRLGLSLHFGSGSMQPGFAPVYVPAVPVLPPTPSRRTVYVPQPAPAPVCVCRHQIGEFVDTRVPLATCVRVRNLCDAAPNAIPAVIAVRDPNMCSHDTEERVAYVQILVPPQPLRSLEISRCRTRVSLCFGEYDVRICSKDGLITVEYDN